MDSAALQKYSAQYLSSLHHIVHKCPEPGSGSPVLEAEVPLTQFYVWVNHRFSSKPAWRDLLLEELRTMGYQYGQYHFAEHPLFNVFLPPQRLLEKVQSQLQTWVQAINYPDKKLPYYLPSRCIEFLVFFGD